MKESDPTKIQNQGLFHESAESLHEIVEAIELSLDVSRANKTPLAYKVTEKILMPFMSQHVSDPSTQKTFRTALLKALRDGREKIFALLGSSALAATPVPGIFDGLRKEIEQMDSPSIFFRLVSSEPFLKTWREELLQKRPLDGQNLDNSGEISTQVMDESEAQEKMQDDLGKEEAKSQKQSVKTSSFVLKEGVRLGNFEIVGKLGAGGMGVVYKGFDPNLKRFVAIKFLLHGGAAKNDRAAKRFSREAGIYARLNHPNIVKVYELGTFQLNPYIVMEYVEGDTLLRYFEKNALSLSQKLKIVYNVVRAVEYAHHAQILHRDIKPSNIMVRTNGEPVLMDFGLGKTMGEKDRSLTKTGEMIGSPHYMSPEQAEGRRKEIDERTDVYGLGSVLYHVLTGRPPVEAESMLQLIYQVSAIPPIPVRSLSPDVHPYLEQLCMKSLEKKKENRQPTVKALADGLQLYLKNRHAMPKTYGVKRFAQNARRSYLIHRSLALVILFGAIAMGMGAWALWLYREKEESPAAVQLRKAQEYQRLGRLHEALESVSSSIRMGPTFEASLFKALLLYELQYHQESHDELESIRKRYPDRRDPKIQYYLGEISETLGALPEAYAHYSNYSNALDPSGLEALRLKVKLGKIAFSLDKEKEAMEHLSRAISRLERSLAEDASKKDRPLLQETIGEALYFQAKILHRKKEYREAEKRFQALLKEENSLLFHGINPLVFRFALPRERKEMISLTRKAMQKRQTLYSELGKIYVQLQRWEEAIECLKNASPETMALLAECHMRQKRWKEGAQIFSRCLEREPWQYDYLFKRGMCYARLVVEESPLGGEEGPSSSRIDEFSEMANRDFYACLTMRPESVEAYFELVLSIVTAGMSRSHAEINNFIRLASDTIPIPKMPDLFEKEKDALKEILSFKKEEMEPMLAEEKEKSLTFFEWMEEPSEFRHPVARLWIVSRYRKEGVYENVHSRFLASDGKNKKKWQGVKTAIEKKWAREIAKYLIRHYLFNDPTAFHEMRRKGALGRECLSTLLTDSSQPIVLRFWAAQAMGDWKDEETQRTLETYRTSADPDVSIFSDVVAMFNGLSNFSRIDRDSSNPYTRAMVVLNTPIWQDNYLRRFLNDPDIRVRLYAAQRLWNYGDREAGAVLRKEMEHSDPGIRAFVLLTYWDFKSIAKNMSRMAEWRKFSKINLREMIWRNFIQLKKESQGCLSSLFDSLKAQDERIRLVALLRLAGLEEKGHTSVLEKMKNDENFLIRLHALRILSQRKRLDIVFPIATAPTTPFIVKMTIVISGMFDILNGKNLSALKSANIDFMTFVRKLSEDRDIRIRMILGIGLGWAKRNTKTPLADAYLKMAARKKDMGSKIGAILGMGITEDKGFLPHLEHFFSDPLLEIRRLAASNWLYVIGENDFREAEEKVVRLSKMAEEIREGGALGFAHLVYDCIPRADEAKRKTWDRDEMYRIYIRHLENKAYGMPAGEMPHDRNISVGVAVATADDGKSASRDKKLSTLSRYITSFSCAIALYPKRSAFYMERGVLLSVAGERANEREEREKHFRQSMHDFEKVLEMEPGNDFARKKLVWVSLRTNETRKASALLDELIERFPLDYELWAQKAQCLKSSGDLDKAEEVEKKAAYLQERATSKLIAELSLWDNFDLPGLERKARFVSPLLHVALLSRIENWIAKER